MNVPVYHVIMVEHVLIWWMVISAPVWKDSWEYVAISVSLIHNILANGVACVRLKDEVLVFSGVFL